MDALRVAKVERVVLERTSHEPPYTSSSVEGTLHLTPHHLFFSPSVANATASGSKEVGSADGTTQLEVNDEVWVPYPIINVLQRLPQAASGLYPLLLSTKTFHSYTFLFERNGEGGAEDVWQSVRDCAITRECCSWKQADLRIGRTIVCFLLLAAKISQFSCEHVVCTTTTDCHQPVVPTLIITYRSYSHRHNTRRRTCC